MEEITWTATGVIVAIIALVVAIWQLGLLRGQIDLLAKQIKFDSDWRRKEKAAELSRFYADEIIPRMSYVGPIANEANIGRIMSGVSRDKIDRFTKDELVQLTHGGIVDEIDEAIMGVSPELFERMYNRLPLHLRPNHNDMPSKDEEIRKYNLNEYRSLVNDMCNMLEYFCICMNSNVADEEIVYQSLHQNMFSIVGTHYYHLAAANINVEDRYYTHIAKLYREWRKKYNKKVNDTSRMVLDDYSAVS